MWRGGGLGATSPHRSACKKKQKKNNKKCASLYSFLLRPLSGHFVIFCKPVCCLRVSLPMPTFPARTCFILCCQACKPHLFCTVNYSLWHHMASSMLAGRGGCDDYMTRKSKSQVSRLFMPPCTYSRLADTKHKHTANKH